MVGGESEKVRWYLEDYAEFPAEPAPALARDAEDLLATVGRCVAVVRAHGSGVGVALLLVRDPTRDRR